MIRDIQNQYRPDFVSHPGETLKDAIDELGISQADLAVRMGRPVKTVSEIVNGKAAITPETAFQLELVLGISASFWNSREKSYREFLALVDKEAEWETQKEWTTQFPLDDLYEHGYVPKVKESAEQVRYILQFLGVNSQDQWATVYDRCSVAFRRSSAFEADVYSLGAWLRAGIVEAQNLRIGTYSKDGFLEALSAVRCLTTESPQIFVPKLQDLCARTGIAVVFVPQFKKSFVSGATRWLTSAHALIQLSLRYKTNDHLWFTFFHEAAHILLHGKKLIFLDTGKNEGNTEKEADNWAADFLIPPKKYQTFLEEGSLSKSSIAEFAGEVGIAPGIVVGRLQHDGLLKFSQCNDLKARFEWVKSRAS